ncbi:MAG: hypothetical protein RL217_973 [Pseudomonadota bacterium]|jgi:uncharacterized protein YutE (UPF0331/DUF86 family)
MEQAYKIAMLQQLAELDEELTEIHQILIQEGYANRIIYRAIERNLQLLVEACIGLDKSQIPWNKVIGMCNALVHDYLNLDRNRVLEIITQRHYASLLDFARALLKN